MTALTSFITTAICSALITPTSRKHRWPVFRTSTRTIANTLTSFGNLSDDGKGLSLRSVNKSNPKGNQGLRRRLLRFWRKTRIILSCLARRSSFARRSNLAASYDTAWTNPRKMLLGWRFQMSELKSITRRCLLSLSLHFSAFNELMRNKQRRQRRAPPRRRRRHLLCFHRKHWRS